MEQALLQDPALNKVWTTVDRALRTTIDAISPEFLDRDAPSAEIDLYALFDPDDGWQMAQLSLDVLGPDLSPGLSVALAEDADGPEGGALDEQG